MEISLLIICVLGGALYFEFCNGWNDSANAIATVVATRVLSPGQAILLAAVLNFLGAYAGQAVAKAIAFTIIKPEAMAMIPPNESQMVVLAAVLSAALWITVVTRMGLPVSGSHSLIGGLLGAGLMMGGFGAIYGPGIGKVIAALLLSPLMGLIVGYLLMATIIWACRKATARAVNSWFGKLQVFSVSWMAFEHGKNDAQKAMGVITLALFAAGYTLPEDHLWVREGGKWQRLTTESGRSVSSEYSLAYDEERRETVLVCNEHEGLVTLVRRGEAWQQMDTVAVSKFIAAPEITYDSMRKEVLLLATSEGGCETWVWNGERWHRQPSSSSPTPRSGHALAYDGKRGVVMLFGGESEDGSKLGGTWIWDGSTWNKVEPAQSPSARSGHQLAYDPEQGTVVLYGGKLDDNTLSKETWSWDGANWTPIKSEGSPPALRDCALTFDPDRHGVVLIGGRSAKGASSPESWLLTGGSWRKNEEEALPALREGLAIVYDPTVGYLRAYGADVENPGVPTWVIFVCAFTMALGTAAGGWKVMATLGQGLIKLRPVEGFAAETASSIVLMVAAEFAMPVSSTHTITAAIMGVGTTKRVSAVRWGTGRKMLYAWIHTFPATMIGGALIYLIGRTVFL